MGVKKQQQGSAVLMAVMALFLLSGMGATTVAIVSTNQSSGTASLASDQAYGLAQAGIEYAKNKIDQGGNPVVQDASLGSGTFTVAALPDAGSITATGEVGNAKKTFTLTTPFGKDCFDIDVTGAHSAADNIVGAKIFKTCLSTTTVTDWTIAWSPNLAEKTTLMQVQGSQIITLYDDQVGFASGTKINATDYSLTSNNPNSPIPINKLQFNTNLLPGKTYTLTAYLSDGSSVTKSFVDPIVGNGNNGDNGNNGNNDNGSGEGGGEETGDDTTPGYDVEADGNVVVDANKAVVVHALCSEITYGAYGPVIPVWAWLGVNGSYDTPLFGGQPVQGGEQYSTSSVNGATYTLKAKAQYKSGKKTLFSATYTSSNVAQVKTLVNGDEAPPLAGFGGQKPVSECVAPYLLNNGTVQLNANQVLLLFELGVNMSGNPNNLAADFQDLVVLMTIQ
ncbi:MAG: hypothetical protein HYV02_05510 [Deltaproteobacteria bacterium]|nr:hypothetical protein [Deltaproteobacteria bacterium]